MASVSAEPAASATVTGRSTTGGPTGSGPDAALLLERLGPMVLGSAVVLGETTVTVAREAVLEAARLLRDERGFHMLRSLTAVDYLPAAPRFQVVYHLVAIPESVARGDPRPTDGDPVRTIRIKVPVPDGDAVVPSIVSVYAGANYFEREVWDMFGIEFAGHPDLRRLLTPAESVGHPLRKDHPLVYERVAFSFNQDELMAQKPRSRD